ncbi:tetratricopeptide repeat protein, partial [candidate division WOR-3 bacterium]|nr:tetratricopeptide repeat protein [candidate division WOR-3 bacterium]
SLTIFLRGGVWKTEADIWLDSAEKTAVYARHGWIRSRVNLASALICESETSGSPEIYISRAESLYLEVKKEYPDFSSVNIGLGNIHLIRGEYDSALVYISAAVRENPSNYFLLNKLAFIYSALGDDNTALILLERAVQIKPDYDEASANLAVLYFMKNDIENSLHIFQLTEVTPRNQKIMKRLEIAFGSLRGEKFIKYDSEMKEAAVLLGNAGLFDEKLYLLEMMRELNPEDPDIFFELALCAALDIGNVSYALTIFDDGDRKFAGDSRFIRGKGLLYFSVGDTANSVLAFKEYLDRFPEDSFGQDIEIFLNQIKNQP